MKQGKPTTMWCCWINHPVTKKTFLLATASKTKKRAMEMYVFIWDSTPSPNQVEKVTVTINPYTK